MNMENADLKSLDVLIDHLQAVQKHGIKLGKGLIQQGEVRLGRELIARVFRHDSRKFYGTEFEQLNGQGDVKSIEFKLALRNHREGEDHHPEFHGGIKNMGRIHLAEFVCDCAARSSHFCTDLVSWLDNQALTTYGFTKADECYAEIMYFVGILLDKPFERIKD
jgi:hypothetical protein